MNERIERAIRELRKNHRTGLCAYLVAGDPDFATTLQAMHLLVEEGVRLLEIGMPFSDPVADGPVIADAHRRALLGGATQGKVLDLVEAFRRTDSTTPVLLMGYANSVLAHGADTFFEAAAMSRVDGAILVDVPLEHNDPFRSAARSRGMSLVPLLAPTADIQRERQILASADGLVYLVSRAGITGEATLQLDSVKERAARARKVPDVGVLAGFGIREPSQVEVLAGAVDLVVVGSLFVEILATGGPDALGRLGESAREMAEALRSPVARSA